MTDHQRREHAIWQRIVADALLHPDIPDTRPAQPCRICGESVPSYDGSLDVCLFHAMYGEDA
jgi:hypothetical protein